MLLLFGGGAPGPWPARQRDQTFTRLLEGFRSPRCVGTVSRPPARALTCRGHDSKSYALVLPSHASFSSYPHTYPEGSGFPVPGGTVQRSHTHASKLRLIAPPTSTFDQPLQCTAALFGALRLPLTAWRSTNLYAPPVAEKVPLESLRAATSSMYEAPRE